MIAPRRFLYACLAAVACASSPRPPPALVANPPLEAKIDPIAKSILTETPAAAVSVAVARAGEVVFAKGYGLADIEHDRKATAATVFRLGSVTKQYTAALVMKMVEAGKLSLEDPITKYLPGYPTHGKTITVRHLLTHTAGVYNYTDREFLRKQAQAVTLPQLIGLFSGKPLDFEPGSKWSYSNSGYVLLGAILEQVSGKSYRRLVTEELLGPTGLDWTWYCPDAPSRPEEAKGYEFVYGGLRTALPINMSTPYAAGALCASAVDLVRWSLALHAGRVVKKESLLQMTTPVALAGGGTFPYGFGLMMGEADGHAIIAHGGGISGFSSHLAYYPKDDVTVAVLVNTESQAADQAAKRIARALFGIPEPKLLDLPLEEAEAQKYVGTYVVEEIPDLPPLKVTFEKGKLYGQVIGPPLHFQNQGQGAFRAAEMDATMTFHVRGERAESVTIEQGGGKFEAKRR